MNALDNRGEIILIILNISSSVTRLFIQLVLIKIFPYKLHLKRAKGSKISLKIAI